LLKPLIAEQGLRNPFVVIDPLFSITELGKSLLGILESEKPFMGFSTNPTLAMVDIALSAYHEKQYDGIVAIGGGSAIDLAKAVGICISNDAEIEQFLQGKPITQPPPFIVAIPTTCGTGAEGTPFAVITDPSVPSKRGFASLLLLPQAVILDPGTLVSLDGRMIAATGIDAFAHVIESYISRNSTAMTRTISLGQLYSLRSSLEAAAFEGTIDALEHLQSIAFTARLLYPRTGLTVAHAAAHPLGAYTNMHHGTAVAILLPESLRYNASSSAEHLDTAARAFGCSSFDEMLTWLDRFIEKTGIRLLARQSLGIDLPLTILAEQTMASSNIPSNPRPIDIDSVTTILQRAVTAARG